MMVAATMNEEKTWLVEACRENVLSEINVDKARAHEVVRHECLVNATNS